MTELTHDRLREVLHYDPETGVWTWLKMLAYRGKIGTRAGYLEPEGYWTIGIDRILYRSNRLAYFYMTGDWPAPGFHIDHKNLNRGDDRWENLRPATGSQNTANEGLRCTNTSGYKGVSWSASKRKWMAYITVRRKEKNLGQFASKEEAYQCYCAAALEAFGEFARFVA